MADIINLNPDADAKKENLNGFPGWTFDHYRGEYYYYSWQEEAYVYGDGSKIKTNMQNKTEQTVDEESELEEDDSDAKSEEYDYDDNWRPCIDSDDYESDFETDPDLREQSDPGGFFVQGKVFRTVWPEVVKETINFRPEIAMEQYREQRYTIKTRFFVVIKEGEGFSTCLPIYPQTPRKGQETNSDSNDYQIPIRWNNHNDGDDSDDHEVQVSESMKNTPAPSSQAITLIPKDGLMYSGRACINFAQSYPVEHSAFVADMGSVPPESVNKLLQYWLTFINSSVSWNEHSPEPECDDNKKGLVVQTVKEIELSELDDLSSHVSLENEQADLQVEEWDIISNTSCVDVV